MINQYDEVLQRYADDIETKIYAGKIPPKKGADMITKLSEWASEYVRKFDDTNDSRD